MILGTAGHIDHGKTTLVRALTGVDTDRLPEEKRRGITIDLGFAPLELEGVGQVGIVDVPGHEAFVRTMVAGATGIDLALLVVAADAGVMPQTREHLAILSLLGVCGGVVAITKCDLADTEWIALVEDDVREATFGSALDGAVIVRVSSTTGAGLDDLRAALSDVARRVPLRSSADLFRLPIDRAFTVKGTGTVVTGTAWSGALTRDMSVRLFPSGVSARVRGIQAHGRAVEVVRAGDRAAVALGGVDLDHVGRGGVLVHGDAWRPSTVLRAQVALLDDAPATLGPRTMVRFHLGTSDVGARLVVRGAALSPGARVSARIVLDEAILMRGGDRFVLRTSSPSSTLGGGVVTDPLAPARARPWPLEVVTPIRVLDRLILDAGASGVMVKELPVRLGLAPNECDALVSTSGAWRVGEMVVGAAVRDHLVAHALATLDEFHRAHALERGAPVQWLRSRLDAPDEIASAVVSLLAAVGEVTLDHGIVARSRYVAILSDAQTLVKNAMLQAIVTAGAEPPSFDELAPRVGASREDVHALARWLAREGFVVAVEPERYYAASTVEALRVRLLAGMTGTNGYSPTDLKGMLDLTRKFLIPFLEYCDREGYTIRDAAGRRKRGT